MVFFGAEVVQFKVHFNIISSCSDLLCEILRFWRQARSRCYSFTKYESSCTLTLICGGGGYFYPRPHPFPSSSWFSLNNSKTVKAAILEYEIDIKLAPVTKLDKRNKITSKKFDAVVMS